MCDIVRGHIVPFQALGRMTDWLVIKKVCSDRSLVNTTSKISSSFQHYKLDSELALKEVQGNLDRERFIIDNIVVSSVAMKSVMT
jgi:EKC/KEOPS complex subunit CGI121/TPRKB